MGYILRDDVVTTVRKCPGRYPERDGSGQHFGEMPDDPAMFRAFAGSARACPCDQTQGRGAVTTAVARSLVHDRPRGSAHRVEQLPRRHSPALTMTIIRRSSK